MWLFYLLCWAAIALGAATNQSTTTAHMESMRAAPATELLSQLSSCALKCVVQEAPKVGCGILDIVCQCASEPLYGHLTECVINSCTIGEAIGLAKVDAQQCHRPTDSRQRMIAGISIASAVVILSAYILRMISRLAISRYCWWDDLFHTISIGFVIPMTVFANLMATHGFGKHLFQIEPEDAPKLWAWFYICQILWAFNILALKMSILCLYLRLFPGRRFRIVCTSALALLVISSLLLIAFDIFQCNPVSAAWTLQHGDAQCMDLTAVALANAAVNIFTETAILIIPLPILVKLKMSTRQKAEVIGLLSLGSIVIIVAAIRVPSLQTLKSLVDATYTNAPVFMWTCLEAMVAHLCVVAPAIKLLFTSVKTQVSTSLENSNTFGYYQSFDGKGGEKSWKVSTVCREGSVTRTGGDQPQQKGQNQGQGHHTREEEEEGGVGGNYQMGSLQQQEDGIHLATRIERKTEPKHVQHKRDTSWLV
ncbi:hypothetical protein PG993_012168 [Apiospora rasikravindrae]|uniref:CFEM domain-containing protein n=1 Tax=Apiospora rasikravindrae TaxID=990691 RepID=A0ABR1S1N6_9PEZI